MEPGVKVRMGAAGPFLVAALLASPVQAQDNRWLTVTPAFSAPARYAGAQLTSYNAWASLRYRSKTRSVLAWRLVIDDRRKNGIYANALVEWSLEADSLRLLNASNYSGGTFEPLPSFALMPEFQTDTTPAPRHFYDAMAYVDSLDAAYFILGALPRVTNYDQNPDPALRAAVDLDQAGTWKYAFAEGRWTRIASSVREFWRDGYCSDCVPFHENHLAYWPSRGRLIFISQFMPTYGRHVAEMDLESGLWSKVVPANAAPFPLDRALSAWDSRREALVFRNGSRVCRYLAATRTFVELPDCGVDADTAARPYYTDIEYLPAEDAYFVVGGNGVTRIFDHGAGAWKTVSQDAAQLDLAAGEEAVYLEHDPATASVALSAGGSGPYGGFRIFRYRPPGAFLRPRRAPGTPAWGGMPAAAGLFPTVAFLLGVGGETRAYSLQGRMLQPVAGKAGPAD